MSATNYPPCGAQVYTIERMIRAARCKELPVEFHLGGRFFQEQGHVGIFAACGRMALPEDCVGRAAPFDLVIVALKRHEIEFDELALPIPGPCRALRVHDFRRVAPAQQAFAEGSGLDFISKTWGWKTAQEWSQFLNQIRSYFLRSGFLEVSTPTLVTNPGMEPELEPFATEWKVGKQKHLLFMHTSPELHLKPLLTQGFSDIFEMKSVFRNEELTLVHEPEFTLLEWYRAFANLENIVQDLSGLLRHLGGGDVRVEQYTMAQIFDQYLHFHLTPQTSKEELFKLATSLNLAPSSELDWNDVFHLIWVAQIEPRLPQTPFLLKKYPPSQAALARRDEAGWADRFEFYWCGLEIANAFHELNDPQEQRTRFERDRMKRREYGRTDLSVDEQFMKALAAGMPPSAGIALGVDRLFMAMKGHKRIADTRPYSYQRE